MSELRDARHRPVLDPAGGRLGRLEQVYCCGCGEGGADSGRPRWLEVAGGLCGMASHLVPASGASVRPEAVVVAWPGEAVAHAPTVDPRDGITTGEDAALSRHYGIDRVESDAAPRGRPEAAQGHGSIT